MPYRQAVQATILFRWGRGLAIGVPVNDIRNIVILTGAGISAESGLATFRGPDGLWEGHRVEDVCTPQALARDPVMVHRFYDARRAALATVKPNPAHVALARLDAEWPGELLIVTQNVDDLHERAGAKRLLHMHGELLSGLCAVCGERQRWEGPMLLPERHPSPSTACKAGAQDKLQPKAEGWGPSLSQQTMSQQDRDIDPSPRWGDGEEFVAPACPHCGAAAIRPDIVFFGEMPYQMDVIDKAIRRADLFASIGTSGAVYPAAGFVRTARHCGAETIELNLDPSEGSIFFHESRLGRASELVPAWVDEVLA